jgi:hypothetical protein
MGVNLLTRLIGKRRALKCYWMRYLQRFRNNNDLPPFPAKPVLNSVIVFPYPCSVNGCFIALLFSAKYS